MKKALSAIGRFPLKAGLLFTAMGFLSALQAQITVTQSNMPGAGTVYIDRVDTMPITVNIGNSGSNQVWNLTALQNEKTDTTVFNVPAGSPCASSFTNSNIVITMPDGIGYIYSSSTGLAIQGFCQDTGNGYMAIKFNPAQTFFTFPSTYLSQFNGTTVMEIRFFMGQMGIDSIKMRSTNNYSSLIDGYGTITTPSYNNVNCLRQKYYEYKTDSVFMKGTITGGTWQFASAYPNNPSYDTVINYRWITNSTDFILAEITMNRTEDTVVDASYLFDTYIGIPETKIENKKVFVSPNPASDEIKIMTGNEDFGKVVITDVLGRKSEWYFSDSPNPIINLSSFSKGIYFYSLFDNTGVMTGNGKFILVK